MQQARLVGGIEIALIEPLAWPVAEHGGDQLAHRAVALQLRSEVEGLAGGIWIGGQRFGEAQVATQGFKHVLPGPGGGRIADRDRPPSSKSAHGIRHDPIGSPIATSDHIAGAGRGDAQMGCLVGSRTAEAIAPAGDGNFCSSLAGAVGIVATEAIGLSVAIGPLAVLIHLVGGDHHHGAGMLEVLERFQQMQRTLHVGGPGAQRVAVAAAHQGLGCQVQHHLGVAAGNELLNSRKISQVSLLMVPAVCI